MRFKGVLGVVVLGLCVAVAACRSQSQELTPDEQEAFAKLDAESDGDPIPPPVLPRRTPSKEPSQRRKPALSDTGSSTQSPLVGSGECFEFNFYNQRKVLLNRDPMVLCKGDAERQVFLRSPQGRVAILNVTSDAIIDPIAGIEFVSDRKLLCFDHNFPPNARRAWLNGVSAVNCCSDIYFEKSQTGKTMSTVAGRVDGPPPNCGQD